MSSVNEVPFSRRGSVASLNLSQIPQVPSRERSNSISSVLNSRRGSVVIINKEEPKKVVILEEEKKECKKNGLRSIQAMVDTLTSKLAVFEKQFRKDQEQISRQHKEISELKESVKDILEG